MSPDSPPSKVDNAWVRRIHTVLRQVFRRAGQGSVKRVEAALSISEGSFRQWRRRGRLELDMLFRTLEELEVPPARFWVEVFGGDLDPVQLAKRPTAPPKDPVVRRAVARWQEPPPSDAESMTDERWRQLDELRGEDPKLAVRRIKAALKTADQKWIPRLLAAYGSALRVQVQLGQALEALHYALLMAEGHDSRATCADILQRLGVAYAYTGNHSLGLMFAKQAAYEHRMAGNLRGEGRSWVDQGLRYGSLDRLDDAIAAYEAALLCLPNDEVRNRFSAWQGLAVANNRRGAVRKAGECAKRAEALASKVDRALAGKLIWVKAEIALRVPDYPHAELCFADVVKLYRKLSPIDAALAGVELARTQVLQGRIDAAYESTKALASFLKPLEGNRVISATLMRLLRITFEGGRVTERNLEQAAGEIRKERARLERHAHPET